MIKVEKLEKSFNNEQVFTNLSFEIESGDFVVITGKSGTGKTTLLNILGFLENYDKGEYFYNCKKVKPNSQKAFNYYKTDISFIFQNFGLIEEENIFENLSFITTNKNEIIDVLSSVGIKKELKTKIFSLSGGEQQRVAIARAILKGSKIILADEPTGNLDEENAINIINILKMLNEKGITVIVVTHDMNISREASKIINIS